MIHIPLKLRTIDVLDTHHVWFAERPLTRHASGLYTYFNCASMADFNGFKRNTGFTKLIRIDQPDKKIQAGFRTNTLYEIRRAEREDLVFGFEKDLEVFTQFYTAFAATKNLKPLPAIFRFYWPHMVVTTMDHGDLTLVMHCYMLDYSTGRCALAFSSSHFRAAMHQQDRNLVGRANRLLHFRDMGWLRDQGFHTYDFGGYAPNTNDPVIANINDFKDAFGGVVAETSSYTSLVLMAAQLAKSLIKRHRRGSEV